MRAGVSGVFLACGLWLLWGGCDVAKGECILGQRRCQDAQTIQVCDRRRVWVTTHCPAGQVCRTSLCIADLPLPDRGAPSESSPGEGSGPCSEAMGARCGGGQRQICVAGGWQEAPCKSGRCQGQGRCQGEPCQEGSRRCISSRWLERCDGQGWSASACSPAQICQFGTCQAEPCDEGKSRCFQGQLQRCQGSQWSAPADCPAGQRCLQGACQPQPGCSEGQKRCADGQTLETCTNGQWSPTPCPSGQGCQGARCVGAPGCSEGQKRCADGQTLETCASGQWKSSPCGPGQQCKGDKCQSTAYSCSLPKATPKIATKFWQHPKAPYAGQTITLSVQSDKVDVKKAPPLQIELTNRKGTRVVSQHTIVGGKTLYYLSAAGLTAGENCVVVKTQDGNVEVATKVMAKDPGAGLPRGNGPWKITRHHMWTCSEQPTYGNLLHVIVRDEKGKPIKGARIRIGWTDDSVFPIPKLPADAHQRHPKEMLTGSDGKAELQTPWGPGIRSPLDGKPGWLVFQISVIGGASDTATEITSGIWESYKQPDGKECNFCSRHGVNVYGHWSYTIEFRRDPKATEICDVPTDHDGQKRCKEYPHAYHEVGKSSCVKVAP